MMPIVNNQQLPYQTQRQKLGGANDRATQNVFMSLPRFVSLVLEAPYVEPLAIAVIEEPESIELVRIIDLKAQDTPVLCGSMCHFAYLPQAGGANIRSIDGLSSDPSSSYRFTFRITYKAQL